MSAPFIFVLVVLFAFGLAMVGVAIWAVVPLWQEARLRQAEMDRRMAAAREQADRYWGISGPPATPHDQPRRGPRS